MSYWFEPKKEDISLSDDGKDLHIWLEQDNSGSVYASVKVEDVRAVLALLSGE